MKRRRLSEIKSRSYKSILLFGLLFTFLFHGLNAQQSLVFNEGFVAFRNAIDLFEKEKYSPAQIYFEKAMEDITDKQSEIYIDAEYYRALCAVELFHANADKLLKDFLEHHPESNYQTEAKFNLAKFQFRKKRYEEALKFLANIDVQDLNEIEQAEYYFKKGYSYFELEDFQNAANAFYEIKDTDNEYVSAARYYYAHISYQDKKYETAASNFMKIQNDPQFGPLVPYYLCQIYYLQAKYEELVAYAPPVLDSAPPSRENEIRKLIGNSHYEMGNYEEALSFLEAYLNKASGTSNDYYQLGYANFQLKNYEKAIIYLQKSIASNDTISQTAYYFIGESNIKLGNKKAAKDAFRSAYRIDADEGIKEDALFNYAKTAYELASHPYDNAILAFEEYIEAYPNSTKIEDAYSYLLGVYYTTKNYKEALASLDRIKDKNIRLLEAKQRIAHYRAIELFRENNFIEAIGLFRISRENNYDPGLYASSLFWIGEAYYQLKDYDNAIDALSEYLASSGARRSADYAKAYYSSAYANFEKGKYSSAAFWFREYVENANSQNKGLINDALLRTGDAYFIQKDYRNAIEYYDKAAEMKMINQDYALLQSSICNGVLGAYPKKIEKLNELIAADPASVYADDALAELGKTYLILNKEESAKVQYEKLIQDYPQSNYLAEAQLKLGLIYFNQKQDELALASFDKVVKDYPNTDNAKEALDKIRQIFIDKGDAEAFENYIAGVPFADISKSKLDSTSYLIAENNYLAGECEKATTSLSNYLSRYPQGLFATKAHYYRAECERKANFEQEAAIDYAYVVRNRPNPYVEKSLVQLAYLYKSTNELDSAISSYELLHQIAQNPKNKEMADLALMQLYFAKDDYQKADDYAKAVLAKEGASVEVFEAAAMIVAKSEYEQERFNEAKEYLDTLSTFNSKIGAEAKYMLARIYYLEGDYTSSDSMVYKLVDQVPSQAYWIAKGFILLADNFISKGDYYNARITFQSVIDNAEDKEIVEIAKEKLAILRQAEELNETNETAPIEIIMEEENIKNESIFEDDNEEGGSNE